MRMNRVGWKDGIIEGWHLCSLQAGALDMKTSRLPPEDPAEKQDTRVVEVVTTLEADGLLIGQRVVVRFLADGGSSHKD